MDDLRERLLGASQRAVSFLGSPATRETLMVHVRYTGRVALGALLVVYLYLSCSLFFRTVEYTADPVVAANASFHVDTSSGRIKDAYGRERIFHGVNVVFKDWPWHPEMEGFHAQMSFSDEDIKILKSLGLNAVRLGVMWPGVHPVRGQKNDTYLGMMKDLVHRLHKAGIHTLVDFHQDVFGARFCGEGVPSWLLDDLPFSSATTSGTPTSQGSLSSGQGRLSSESKVHADSGSAKSAQVIATPASRLLHPVAGLEGRQGAAAQAATPWEAGLLEGHAGPSVGASGRRGRGGAQSSRKKLLESSSPQRQGGVPEGRHFEQEPHQEGDSWNRSSLEGVCVGFAVCMKPPQYAQSFPEPLHPRFGTGKRGAKAHGDAPAVFSDLPGALAARLAKAKDYMSHRQQLRALRAKSGTNVARLRGDDPGPMGVEESPSSPNRWGEKPSETQCLSIDWGIYHFTFAVARAFQDLYENRWGWRDRLAEYWRDVAEALKGEEGVLGFDLMNEPWVGDIFLNPLLLAPGVADRLNFQPLYDHLQREIRRVDPSRLLFFEASTFDDLASGFTDVPGGRGYANMSVLSYHYYRPPNLGPRAAFLQHEAESKRLQCGWMLTEFNVPNRRSDWLASSRPAQPARPSLEAKLKPGVACLPVPDGVSAAPGCGDGAKSCAGKSAETWADFAEAWGRETNRTALVDGWSGQALARVALSAKCPSCSGSGRRNHKEPAGDATTTRGMSGGPAGNKVGEVEVLVQRGLVTGPLGNQATRGGSGSGMAEKQGLHSEDMQRRSLAESSGRGTVSYGPGVTSTLKSTGNKALDFLQGPFSAPYSREDLEAADKDMQLQEGVPSSATVDLGQAAEADRLVVGGAGDEADGRKVTPGSWTEMVETLGLADEHVQSWMAWEYKPYVPITGANYGLFQPDGKLHPLVVQFFWRTYPIAVAGRIERFGFDAYNSSFEMVYWPAVGGEESTREESTREEKSQGLAGSLKASVCRFIGGLFPAYCTSARLPDPDRRNNERCGLPGKSDPVWETEISVCCNRKMRAYVNATGVEVEWANGGSLLRLRHRCEPSGSSRAPVLVRVAPWDAL